MIVQANTNTSSVYRLLPIFEPSGIRLTCLDLRSLTNMVWASPGFSDRSSSSGVDVPSGLEGIMCRVVFGGKTDPASADSTISGLSSRTVDRMSRLLDDDSLLASSYLTLSLFSLAVRSSL